VTCGVRGASRKGPAAGRVSAAVGARAPLLDRVLAPVRWVAAVDGVANDRDLARSIAADPTAGASRMPLGWLRSYLDSTRPEPEAFDACPVVLAHPAADTWTPVELSVRFLHRLRPELRELTLLEDGGHLPVERRALHRLAEVLVARLGRGQEPPPALRDRW
jgi:alpha-beta hydrolase superfamily lysophospholipase